ncbi:acyltransferase family protein [Paractinoplanes lichenicola]|uniref:Acyltransferase n=1 Tax=Paractinoplanes lichenicola TaxID=2802976 RepID=A0ABS1VX19_9ACTN|nr:acyltransferase [Actinoplanes lichenicola]MBL7259039.1 acyltransferase [Actinoplanes lichenicola]
MRRLDWLDALRGLAALTVVLFHLSPQVIGTEAHLAVMRHIDLGKTAVLLFFLVSGYVIPMSLERHGSLRRFWIGRLFRIYPAYLATIAVFALLAAAGLLHWQASLRAETGTGVLAHVTMMPDLVGVRGVVRVFWTLSYEMVFYLVVTGLYAWGLHRHSAWYAAALALTAWAVPLPDALLGENRRLLAALLLLGLLLTLTLVFAARSRAAGVIGIGFVLVPALNGHPAAASTVRSSQQALLLLAVMFAGTVVYRWQHGQIGRVAGPAALGVVAASVVGAQWTQRAWLADVFAVATIFLIAYVFRHRTMPRALTWLGRISYSLYLLHVIVLFLLPRIVPDLGTQPLPVRVITGLAYLASVLGLAWLSYRIVERPAQRLGRRLLDKIDTRHPPPPIPATQRAAPGTGRGENARESV